jgi:hypothetical protein
MRTPTAARQRPAPGPPRSRPAVFFDSAAASAPAGRLAAQFFNHAQTLAPAGTAQERYVEALCLLLLNRSASINEITGQVNLLGAIGQAGIALEFLTSREFRTDLVEAYYNVLLHRPSDPAGRNNWVFSGIDAATMRVDLEATAEFFTNG